MSRLSPQPWQPQPRQPRARRTDWHSLSRTLNSHPAPRHGRGTRGRAGGGAAGGAAAKLAPGFLASVSSHSIGFIFIVGRPRTYVISRRDFDSRVYLRAQWEFSTLARRAAPASRARMPGSLRSRRWPPAPPWRRPPTTSAALLRTLSSLGQPEVAGHSNDRQAAFCCCKVLVLRNLRRGGAGPGDCNGA